MRPALYNLVETHIRDFIAIRNRTSLAALALPLFGSEYLASSSTMIPLDTQAVDVWEENCLHCKKVKGRRSSCLFFWKHHASSFHGLFCDVSKFAGDGDVVKPLLDLNRLDYVQGHLRAAGQALEEGVNLGGYFCWSFLLAVVGFASSCSVVWVLPGSKPKIYCPC